VFQILSYQKTYTLAQLKLNFLTLQPESQFDFDKLISSFFRISFFVVYFSDGFGQKNKRVIFFKANQQIKKKIMIYFKNKNGKKCFFQF